MIIYTGIQVKWKFRGSRLLLIFAPGERFGSSDISSYWDFRIIDPPEYDPGKTTIVAEMNLVWAGADQDEVEAEDLWPLLASFLGNKYINFDKELLPKAKDALERVVAKYNSRIRTTRETAIAV